MPVSPELAAGLARGTVDVYADAERVLLARIARSLAAGMDSPTWAEQKLLHVQLLRLQAEQLLAALAGPVEQAVAEAVAVAYNRGAAAAAGDLAGVLGVALEEVVDPVPGHAAVQRLVAEAVTNVTATHARILRSTVDAYRTVVADASGQVLVGTVTRRQAAQRALDRFAARGVTGFVDRAGRGWQLESYVEMAVRTTTARAAVNAHADRLQALGQDLVIVSDAPQECRLCRPWEGRVLSLTGATVGAVDGAGGVRVAGTLDEARAAGLFHPGCRHSTGLYQAGVTRLPSRTADPEGDRDRQRLRALERETRKAKRLEAVALDDVARGKAAARVRARQAQIREHTRSTSAKRQPHRERIGAAR
jgi:hypothetical protein